LFRLYGRLDHNGVAEVWHQAIAFARQRGELVLDVSGIDYVDGTGAALLVRMEEVCAEQGGTMSIQGLHPEFSSLVSMYREDNRKRSAPLAPVRPGFVEQVGSNAAEIAMDFLRFVAFLGEAFVGLFAALFAPGRIRWRDTRDLAERVGFNALPIIMLIGFLMGLGSFLPVRHPAAQVRRRAVRRGHARNGHVPRTGAP
jgi:phospholipid/cholesterol/gamma-HCH transport system permease protein